MLSLQNSLTTVMLNYKWFCMNIDKSFSSCSNSYYFNFQWKFIPLVGILRSWRHTPHSHNELNLIMKVHFYFYAPAFLQDFFNFCIKMILCGSCHLDRLSNFEIGVEYWMTFVVVVFQLQLSFEFCDTFKVLKLSVVYDVVYFIHWWYGTLLFKT